MNEFTVTVDVKQVMTSQHAIESLQAIEQAAREAANRLHIMGLDLEVRVVVKDRGSGLV